MSSREREAFDHWESNDEREIYDVSSLQCHLKFRRRERKKSDQHDLSKDKLRTVDSFQHDHETRQDSAGSCPVDSDTIGITIEMADIVLQPMQGSVDILESIVAFILTWDIEKS